jgi:hypothetical protein
VARQLKWMQPARLPERVALAAAPGS